MVPGAGQDLTTPERKSPDGGGPRRRFLLLGVGVDRVTIEQAVRRIDTFVRTTRPHHIVTVNPEFIMQARGDRHFRRVLNQADLAVADGIGVVWAARILGDRLPERVGGIDLVERLAQQAADRGYRLFLLGAAPGVASTAAQVLRRRHPRLCVASTYAGSPQPAEEEQICALIRAARPHLLLVAFGAPAQDLWIARNLPRLDVPVAIGVGGAFDFLAGRVPRAPLLLQRCGLEWLFRLARQPWRWRRMLALPRFALMVLAIRVLPDA